MNAQASLAPRIGGVAGLLAAAALAAPAPAGAAPTIRTDLRCYSPGQTVEVTGSGFTPAGGIGLIFQLMGAHGSNILFPDDPMNADAAGSFDVKLPAPKLASDSDVRETVTLTGNDMATIGPNGPLGPPEQSIAATQFLLSAVDVIVRPWFRGQADPRLPTTFTIVGWEPFHKVYAHYFLAGKRVKTVLVGSVSGPCGNLTRTMRQFPFRPVPAGTYKIRFSPSRVFDPEGFWVGYRGIVVPRSKAVA